VSPRPYRLGKRQAAADETRSRILAAARELLAAAGGIDGFTIDAVARHAGVARMTVYYQFGSKPGLLEALFDDVAARGGLERLEAAFGQPDPRATLAGFIAAFAHFWGSDRRLHRRIHGLAALDAEVEQSLRAREEWRREGLRKIVGRLLGQQARSPSARREEVVDLLFMLTSFETFDNLAAAARTPDEVASLVQRLARAALGLSGGEAPR
jgi:AcrR family transcriptional regulator